MIGRMWHGWTTAEIAEAYEELLRREILPGIVAEHEGCLGAWLLRRVEDERRGEVEFVTLTLFEDMDAVRAFSHDGARGAVVPAAARRLLERFDDASSHYEVVEGPEAPGRTP